MIPPTPTVPVAPPAVPMVSAATVSTPAVALTIAGSDSGAGAGIQADLKVFAALGLYGTSAITATTAQNTLGVRAVHPIPARLVTAQVDAVLTDLPVGAVKTGMLGTARIASAVAALARDGRLPNLVVDPVLVSTSGHRLGVVGAVERLLPYAMVVTPNRAEAAALLGWPVRTPSEMARAAAEIAAAGPAWVVITGGDLPELASDGPATGGVFDGDPATGGVPDGQPGDWGGETSGVAGAVDVVWGAGGVWFLRGARIATRNTHGTGCTFSAAIAARLALGDEVPAALRFAKEYVARTLAGARHWMLGGGHGPVDHFGWSSVPTT